MEARLSPDHRMLQSCLPVAEPIHYSCLHNFCGCRCEGAIIDLEAAQHIYMALGQQAKGNTLEVDLAKIRQLWPSIHTKHA